jgi:glycosyltransferase involved in cell wall biosynthesis
MSTEKPLISVVVPAYNEEKYLPKTLEALKNQDFDKPYEIIVVNNNSTDRTEEISRSYGAKVIREQQQGLIFAKQTGCKYAKGKIIAVLDADNIPPPDWLQTINIHLTNNGSAAVTGPYQIPTNAPWWGKAHNNLGICLVEIVNRFTKNAVHIWGGNVAFKKKAFEKIGGYDTNYTFTADEEKLRKDFLKLDYIIHYDKKLAVTTSTRRFIHGPRYFFIEFLIKGYVLNYILTTFFNKPLSPPENIREEIS